MKTSRIDAIYAALSGDDSTERRCEAIPDAACTDVPRNYVLNVANGAATKLAEQIAGPNLVLPWLLGALGAPAAAVALLAPVKQAGSLVPQLLVAARIRAYAVRKWWWAGAGITQAACLGAMALAVWTLPPSVSAWLVLALLAAFSVASGAGSVAFQDVLGKTVPKGRRGRLLANRAMLGGVLGLGAGAGLRVAMDSGAGPASMAWLIVFAAALWLLAAWAFAAIDEVPGATEGGRNPASGLASALGTALAARDFRRFLAARTGLLAAEIGAPVLVLHAVSVHGPGPGLLGLAVVATAAAGIVSSALWGPLADRSSRLTMALAGAVAVAAAGTALALGGSAAGREWPALYAAVFLVLGVAEAGVRVGRKTWLVDASPSADRATYAAAANTLTGVAAIAAGAGLGAAAQHSTSLAVALLGALAGLGAVASATLAEAGRAEMAATGPEGART